MKKSWKKGRWFENTIIFICSLDRMRKSLIVLIFHFTTLALYGQVLMNKDSLLKLLPQAKEDTNAVQFYINLGQQFESNEPQTAKSYYKRAGNLSRKLNYPKGVIKYINNYTFVLNMQGLYDSSLLLNLQGVAIAREIKDSTNLAYTLFNAGSSYRMKGEYEKAVQYYEEAKILFQKFGNQLTAAQGEDILGLLYFDMHLYEKGIQSGEKSVYVLRQLNNLPMLGAALNNLGLNYMGSNRMDEAKSLFLEALEISKRIGDKNLEHSQYLNLGDISQEKGDYDGMKQYMDKALALSKELELRESELLANRGLSYYFLFKKEYKLSEQYGHRALAMSYQYNLRTQRQKVFVHLSNLAYAMQNVKLGEHYADQSTFLGDSLLNETIHRNTLDLEKKYETAKKESQIKQLEAHRKVQKLSLQRSSIFNYTLISGILVLGIIFILSYRTYKQKQILQQHRIVELEREKQLTATEAVLKGEEQERSRLAKDLHDGLGGMLAGIKYSFNNMKGNLVMTAENLQAFERSMDMLDSSIKEMRRVAHNMMPESLVRFGLDTALKDFCNDINQSGALQVKYQSIGLADAVIDQTTAITLYRIVQELIHNTLKHAGAQLAIVQVTKADQQVSVTVEDDGKGFDTNISRHPGGVGWSNIRHRVDFLKGKLDLDSQPGKGTSVHIEFNT
jgi:two-component system, NarL family, sensor kinase